MDKTKIWLPGTEVRELNSSETFVFKEEKFEKYIDTVSGRMYNTITDTVSMPK